MNTIKLDQIRSKDKYIIWIIIIAGCVLRLTLAVIARHEVTPFDDLDYLRKGLSFIRGGANDCWRAPMQYWLIGILLPLADYHFIPVRATQALLTCCLLPLIYLLARRFTDTKTSLLVLIVSAVWVEFGRRTRQRGVDLQQLQHGLGSLGRKVFKGWLGGLSGRGQEDCIFALLENHCRRKRN